jgi:hypothetical protein
MTVIHKYRQTFCTFVHNSGPVFGTFIPSLSLWPNAWPFLPHPQTDLWCFPTWLWSDTWHCPQQLLGDFQCCVSDQQCYLWQFCPDHTDKLQTSSNVALCTSWHTTTVIPCHLVSCCVCWTGITEPREACQACSSLSCDHMWRCCWA